MHKLVNFFTFLLLILVYMTFLPFIEGRKRKNSTHVQILMVTCITCKVAIYIYKYTHIATVFCAIFTGTCL